MHLYPQTHSHTWFWWALNQTDRGLSATVRCIYVSKHSHTNNEGEGGWWLWQRDIVLWFCLASPPLCLSLCLSSFSKKHISDSSLCLCVVLSVCLSVCLYLPTVSLSFCISLISPYVSLCVRNTHTCCQPLAVQVLRGNAVSDNFLWAKREKLFLHLFFSCSPPVSILSIPPCILPGDVASLLASGACLLVCVCVCLFSIVLWISPDTTTFL